MTQPLDLLTGNPAVSGVLLAVASAGIGLWLVTAWWVYADISRRARPELLRLAAPAWILLSTPLLLPLSLASYLLARPQRTVAERRSSEILEALAPTLPEQRTCPGCGGAAVPEWRRCPACATWLRAPCAACGRWSSTDLDVCPFCATESGADVEDEAGAAASSPRLTAAALGSDATPGPREQQRGRGNREARVDRRTPVATAASGTALTRIGR